jgi:phosphohistidine phosphatase
MPKILTAIRHAKSSWDEPALADRERPLNNRGRRAAPGVARYLLRLDHLPDGMLSSPARRAYETALLMAGVLSFPEAGIRRDERLYFEGVDGIAAAIRETPDDVERLFFFSHEPVISAFCDRFCRLGKLHYPTSAVCAMQFDVDHWAAMEERGRKLFFVIPKIIDPSL